MKRMFVIPVFIALASMLAAAFAVARSEEDFESYWNEIRFTAESNDRDALSRIVEADRANAERAYWRAADRYVDLRLRTEEEAARTMRRVAEGIARAYASVHGTGDFVRHVRYLVSLDLVESQLWRNAFGSYHEFLDRYHRATDASAPDPEGVETALDAMKSPYEAFEFLGDFYLQGMLQSCAGVLHSRVGQLEEAKRALEIAVACFDTVDSEREVETAKRRLETVEGLLEKAERDRKEELESRGLSPEGSIPWTTIPMEYVADRDGFPPTAHPYTVDEYLLWYRVLVPEDEPTSFHESFEGNRAMWTSYYAEVFERWPVQESLLAPYSLLEQDSELGLDADGDGTLAHSEQLDVTTRPRVVEIEGLRAPDGTSFAYAVEMVDIGEETWFGQPNTRFANPGQKAIGYRRACHREGELDRETLLLVDDDSNGTYFDVGADSLFVEGERPCFLGKIMRIGGEIREVRVPDALGREVKLRPWTGPTGRIRVRWSGPVEPEYLHVRGTSVGILNAIFPLDVDETVEVPAGEYELYWGQIRRGRGRRVESVEIRRGESEPIAVESDGTAELRLGAPFRIEYEIDETPEAYWIRGRSLRVLGAAGELYTRFFEDVPLGEAVVRIRGGGIVESGRLRRVEYQDRLKDANAVWYPKDLEIDKRKAGTDAEFEASFRLEADLLGRIRTDFLLPE